VAGSLGGDICIDGLPVLKRTLMRPRQKSISTTSFMMGSRPVCVWRGGEGEAIVRGGRGG
jgi:hypothetical protein